MTLEALTLVAALCGAGETVLLDFSAEWCGPCRAMAPTIQRMQTDGYPIRQVNVDRERPLAAQFGVRALPCFVMLVDGREVDRLEGPASYARLVKMFEDARRASEGQGLVRGQSPRGVPQASRLGQPPRAAAPPMPQQSPVSPPVASPAAPPKATAEQRALLATVRLRIDDSRGHSYGTGTVIDTHGDESLVVTCGHIFRDSRGEGQITVDVFHSGTAHSLPGQLVHYDLQRDIGFVSFRAGRAVTSVRVAPSGYRLRPSDEVFSVGCDHGADPSVRNSRVSAIDKYLGSPNVEVAGQPVDGRSGGGLFSPDGLLVGVCNAADPADDEGIYAALGTIQQQLDQIGQQRVYQSSDASLVSSETAAPAPARPAQAAVAPPSSLSQVSSPVAPDRAPGYRSDTRESLPRERTRAEGEQVADAEVICIVRSRDDPQGQSRVFILDRPSASLLERLRQESSEAGSLPATVADDRVNRQATLQITSASARPAPAAPPRAAPPAALPAQSL